MCSTASLLNTHRPQSLFEASIKARINYQLRNMETKYVVPNFKEYPIYIYIYQICIRMHSDKDEHFIYSEIQTHTSAIPWRESLQLGYMDIPMESSSCYSAPTCLYSFVLVLLLQTVELPTL